MFQKRFESNEFDWGFTVCSKIFESNKFDQAYMGIEDM